jgi:hypothetical protein
VAQSERRVGGSGRLGGVGWVPVKCVGVLIPRHSARSSLWEWLQPRCFGGRASRLKPLLRRGYSDVVAITGRAQVRSYKTAAMYGRYRPTAGSTRRSAGSTGSPSEAVRLERSGRVAGEAWVPTVCESYTDVCSQTPAQPHGPVGRVRRGETTAHRANNPATPLTKNIVRNTESSPAMS